MTDATPTPSTPAPAAAGPKQTLSIVGFILGIASVVFCATGIVAIGAGIAAIIVSQKGKKTEPGAPSWMHTVGVITGIAGIVLGVVVGLLVIGLPILFSLISLGTLGTIGSSY